MKTKRTASIHIRKARAQDKLDALEAWRLKELEHRPAELRAKYAEQIRALEFERDSAIANVPQVVGVKYQERYVRLVSTFDDDVRAAIEAEAV
jgi:hypothetical protein